MTEASVVELSRSVAGFSAPGGARRSPAPVDGRLWPRCVPFLQAQRITGLAVGMVESGILSLTDEQFTLLLGHHREAMKWSLVVERTTLEMVRRLSERGIRCVVLKGSSFAHVAYPDPAWRPFADVDLLVGAGDWRRACEALEEAGATREVPEPRPGFDERFGKAAVFQTDRRVQVDLHVRLALGPFGIWIEPAELLSNATQMSLGGRTLLRLSDTDALLHACVHASLGTSPPLLMPLRDVVQFASMDAIDWSRFGELTARWRLGVVIRHAMRQAQATLRVSLPTGADRSLAYAATAREEDMLRSYTAKRQARGGVAVATLRAIPGWSSKAAYVRALALPNRDFLAARTGTRRPIRSHVERWKVPVGWTRSGRG